MTTAQAPERAFATFSRGQLRDDFLGNFRIGLRQIVNPETNEPFSESEIATATAKLSNWYAEADALDLILLGVGEARALFLADQLRIDRAGTAFLESFHLPQWGEVRLEASGGSGPATAPATVGTTFQGSTTVPDPTAAVATDPAGLSYQVLFTKVTPASGVAELQLVGIDTGAETNLPAGTQLTWSNPPLGATAKATVTTLFTGGHATESDSDAAKRLLSRIRHKPASGNNAHLRGWARASSVAVYDACIYACAFHAGSSLICVLQKRGTVLGPSGRLASVGTLNAATAYLTPPGSPVAPSPPHYVVVPHVAQEADLTLSLSMPRGRSSGWDDLSPWPTQAAGVAAEITAVTSQTLFRMSSPVALPSGVTAPSLMVWDAAQSRFAQLLVTSVVSAGAGLYDVTLSAPPSAPIVNEGQSATPPTLAVGQYVSPFTQRLKLVGETVEAYFDSLGPGEVIVLATDLRANRAFRFPEPAEELPQRAGSSVLTWLRDALGAALSDSTLDASSVSTPTVPTEPALGPSLIVAGRVGVYPLN